jgi:uncharacterized protein YaiE (UPF0345 family)
MSDLPDRFAGVTAVAKANIYFNGDVVSHTIFMPDGSKKTLGLIFPGSFYFGTEAAERMQIVAGTCKVKLKTETQLKDYSAGQHFDVPAKSGFDIEVSSGVCEYICTFLS